MTDDNALRKSEKSDLERALQRRFAALRREETMTAPPAEALLQRRPAPAPARRQVAPAAGAAALAASVVLALVLLPERQRPETLYLEVMSANRVVTDQLLDASPGTLPGIGNLPRLHDSELPNPTQWQLNDSRGIEGDLL